MKRTPNLTRIEERTEALKSPAPPLALPAPPVNEARDLARELIEGLKAELDIYRRANERDKAKLADPAESPPDWYIQNQLECPAQDVTFGGLSRLAQHDVERMHARWEEVKAVARDDLDSGWLAARALETMGGSAWERACFLATRTALRQSLQPRNEFEAMLLDEMAQYETLRRRWVGLFSMLSNSQATVNNLGQPCESTNRPRPVTATQAVNEASRMVEKMQRLYHQTLRTLLGMRRGKATFFVRHVDQFNVNPNQPTNDSGDSPGG